MNQETRTCRTCGRWTVCLVEECERCGGAEVSICEVCVAETESGAADVQARTHARTCGVTIGPKGRPVRMPVRRCLSEVWSPSEEGRALARSLPLPTRIPRATERCWTPDRPPPTELLQRDRHRPRGAPPD